MTVIDFDRYRHGIADVRRMIANAEGQLQGETARRDKLMREVGEAKGRRDLKPKIDKFLEDTQADFHSRIVGKYEQLLTTFVNEVMQGQAPIGLDLTIKRGQPALDIVSRVTADIAKDIYRHKGGALTNLISLGLRMIVITRSKRRRFMILDEADCWAQTEKIPAFYKVVREGANKLGIQSIAISHFPTSMFGDDVNIVRLSGHPESPTGTNVNNNPRRHHWSDDEEGFRYMRLINFQGYVNETLHLTPGTTVISGDNDLGKSSFVRAMRAVFYGDREIDDGLIRDGERMCAVEIGLKNGRVLRWDRQIRRNPVNLWTLKEADGSVVTVHNDDGSVASRYETGGDLPDWVEREFGISPVHGLDAHLTIQKEPVFLLTESPQVRALVLSVGQEASYISGMIAKHKEQVAADSTTIREGEKEMIKILERVEKLEKAVAKVDMLEKAEAVFATLKLRAAVIEDAGKRLADIERVARQLDILRRKAQILEFVPELEDVRGLEVDMRETDRLAALHRNIVDIDRRIERQRRTVEVLERLPVAIPTIKSSDRLIEIGRSLAGTKADVERLTQVRDVLARVPEKPPVLRDMSTAGEVARNISSAQAAVTTAGRKLSEIDGRMATTKAEIDAIVASFGDSCPVCGTHIDDGSKFMAVHTHGVAA
jgi:hypothetical protein